MLPDNIHEMISDVRTQYILDRYLKIVKLPKYRNASVSKEQDIKDFKKILKLGYFTENDLAKYYKNVKGKLPPPLSKDFEQLVYDVYYKTQPKKQKIISPKASSSRVSPERINFDDTKQFKAYFDALEIKENKKRKNLSNDLINQGFANPLNIPEKRYFDVIKKDIQKQIKNMNKEHLKEYKADEFVKSIYKREQDAQNYNSDAYKNKKYFKGGIHQGLTKQEKLSAQMNNLSLKPKKISATKNDIEEIRKLVRAITSEEKEKKAKRTIKLNVPVIKNNLEKITKSIQTITLKQKQKRRRSVSSSGSSSGSSPVIDIKSPTSSEDNVFGYDSA